LLLYLAYCAFLAKIALSMYAVILYALIALAAMRGKKDNRKDVNDESCNNRPPLPIPIPVNHVPPTPTDKERANQEEKESREKWKFRLEVAGAVILTVYAGFTIAIWWANKRAADAAGIAANSAKNALEVAREAGRPWIGPIRATPVRTKSGFKVTIEFTNGGVRPARIIGSKSSGHMYETFPDSPDYGESIVSQSRQIMVANKRGFFQFETPVSDTEMRQLESETLTLYFYGIVNYEDVSGNSHHTTKMCWFYIPSSKDTGSCAVYNDAD
jgi:hypothetical protein